MPKHNAEATADTIRGAAEEAAKKIPSAVRGETYKVEIYAELSGEHNPIHGFRVVLTPGSP
jgi:hypothetical protein